MKLPKEDQKKWMDELFRCTPNDKIGMIKSLRSLVPGLGLADAKNMVERHLRPGNSAASVVQGIRQEISAHLTPTFTKEQFLGILGRMIDQSDALYFDPLDAVIVGCQNLKEKGGLEWASRQDEILIDSI